MSSNAKQFESKDITISANGQILKNGIARVTPGKDPETGLPTFQVYDPNAKSLYSTRFLHVELFRLYSGIEQCPRLDPEDVEFIEGTRMHVNNLQLTDSGRAKVYGSGESEAEGPTPGPSLSGEAPDKEGSEGTSGTLAPSEDVADGDGEPTSETSEDVSVSSEEEDHPPAPPSKGATEGPTPGPSLSAKAPDQEGSEDEPVVGEDPDDRVFAVKGNGSFYLLEDAAGNDLLPTYNDGKQINGRKNVEAIAEEYGLDVVFGRE